MSQFGTTPGTHKGRPNGRIAKTPITKHQTHSETRTP